MAETIASSMLVQQRSSDADIVPVGGLAFAVDRRAIFGQFGKEGKKLIEAGIEVGHVCNRKDLDQRRSGFVAPDSFITLPGSAQNDTGFPLLSLPTRIR
ncbi:hypothetical protein N8D56_18795 [Devosia sp. A8/3-2]|nr:hypothetical protein N8D56_18795 [Devosia sp. A8/3-2]